MRERKRIVIALTMLLAVVCSSAIANGTGSISGQITKHVGGSSLEGVWVNLYQGEDENIADEDAWDWVTSVDANPVHTDSNGEYQFTGLAERRYRISVYDQEISGTHYFEAELYHVQVFSDDNTPNMDIELRRAGWIYGYVKTAGGVPIPNAEVVTEAAWTQYGRDWHTERTDSAGRYEFWVAPSPGKFYPIWVREASLDGIFYETRWDGEFYRATVSGTYVPEYLLEVGGTVTGRVINEDDIGIEGVWVESQWNKYEFEGGSWTETNSDGYFELNGLPSGTNYIYVDNTGRETEQDGVKYQVGETHAGPLNITPGEPVDAGTFTIYQAGMITGIVTDEAGQPVPVAEVAVEGTDINGEWADREDVITGAFGQYTLDYVAPGTYVFECSKDGFLTTKIIDVRVSRGEHVDLDVVLKHASEGATISGAITNYSAVAAYDSENHVYYPYYDDNDYCDFGLPEFELLAVRMDQTYTDEDYLDPDRFIIEWIDDDKIDDGYGDYFENDGNETPGHYETVLPAGDVAIGMSIYQDFLPGWGGCVILHDWQRFNLTKGDSIENVNFTAVTTSTGTLNGEITVPLGYTNFPEDWCLIYAYGLDDENHIKTAMPLGDAVAFPGWTKTYEFRNLPVGNYMLKAYARNLPSIVISSVTVTAGSPTTQAIDFTATSSCTLTGHITSGASDVSGAVVTIEESGRQTTTDISGNYTITGINEGTYTVKVSASGYADVEASVSIIAGPLTTQNFSLSSNVGTISGTVKTTGSNNINGATVVAYNETDDTFKTAETVGGVFSFTGLTPGQYILAVDTEDYGVVVFPSGGGRITLSANQNIDPNDIAITVETLQPPVFTVSSSASDDTPVVLSLVFYSDKPLEEDPLVTVVTGNGSLGVLAPNGALNRFEISYTANASDDMVLIRIEEVDPLVQGNTAGKTFTFEVGSNLVQTSTTNVTNAMGGEARIMGTQDNTQIYVPPFAIAGADDTQALSLTIERYGDPGDAVEGTDAQSVSAVYDFEFDDEGVTIDENHTFTITMSFQLPAGMTQEEFEDTFVVRYFDAGDQQWKTDGVSNVRINWASSTIMFEVSHLTKFAVFTGNYHPADTNSDQVISISEIVSYINQWAAGDVSISDVVKGINLWAAGHYYWDSNAQKFEPGEQS